MDGRNANASRTIGRRVQLLARLEMMPASLRRAILLPAIRAAQVDELPGLLPSALGEDDPELQTLAVARSAELPIELRIQLPLPKSAATLRRALDAANLEGHDAGAVYAALLELVERNGWLAGLDAVLDGLVTTNDAMIEALDDNLGELRSNAGAIFPLLVLPDHESAADQVEIDRVMARAARLVRAHRNEDVLLAIALRLPRAGTELSAVADDPEADLHGAIRAVAERTDDPRVRRMLVRWLGVPALGRAVSRWLHRINDAGNLADLLHDGHLLRAPRRRQLLRQADRALRVVPDRAVMEQLSVGAMLGAVELVARLDLTPATRNERLALYADLPHPMVRLRVIEHLDCGGRRRNVPALERAAADPVPVVARRAIQALGDTARAGAALKLASRHPGIARRARRDQSMATPEAFCAAMNELNPRDRRAVARRLAHRDPAAFAAALIRLATAAPRVDRQEALDLIHRLDLARHVGDDLARLTETSDPYVAATALRTIAGLGDVAETAATAQLDADRPPRVRANAIELLARYAPVRHRQRLTRLTQDEANRGRANAAIGLVRVDPKDGGAAIRALLADSDPLTRISGIWAARTSALSELIPAVQSLERDDPAPMIRTRAAAARRLLDRRSQVPVELNRLTAVGGRDHDVEDLNARASDARRAGRHVLKSNPRENAP